MKKSKPKNFNKGTAEEVKDNSSSSRSSRKGNPKKGNNLGYSARDAKSKDTSSDFVCSTGKPTNDPRWYINNPYLSRDVGSIWFSRPTGDKFPPVAFANTYPTAIQRDQYDPGILAFPSILTWGGTREYGNNSPLNSPINLTAQKLYQYVVHANSRNISYDKKDLLMTLMAIDAVYAVITEAIRAYRLISNYDPENRYVNGLLTALRWDRTDLRSRVAEFRYTINWAISRVNKFYMPSLFDMVRAHVACYEYIYADRPTNKAQYYVKYSAGVWVYNDVEGALEYKNVWSASDGSGRIDWSTLHTVDTFRNVIADLIARIENAQYLGVMQGDLLKAFGFENMSQYAYLNIDVPISPVYDEEFLYKLHNAHISFRGADLNSGLWVKQTTSGGIVLDSACIIYRDDDNVSGNISQYHADLIPIKGYEYWTKSGTLVDLPATVPASPENVLLMNLYKLDYDKVYVGKWYLSDSGNTNGLYTSETPPEILLEGRLYADPDNMGFYYGVHSWNQSAGQMGMLSRFAITPLITQENINDTDQIPFFWHTDNVSVVSHSMYYRIMDVIYWSLWSNATISSSAEAVRDSRI